VVLNQNNYFFDLSNSQGNINSNAIVYSSTDCSGSAYVSSKVGSGYVFNHFNQLYFVNLNATPINNFTFNSVKNSYPNGSVDCTNISDEQYNTIVAWPFEINNPIITGVNSASFPLPITIGRKN